MHVVAFVSGHGFGHAVREIEILRHLPESIALTVVTGSPAWFWREELRRPFTLHHGVYDVGCVQTDSLTVDGPATLQAWRETAHRNEANRGRLGDWLETIGARVVVSDVPSFPLTVAAERRIPTVCVANFTWADIYAEIPPLAGEAGALESEYARADLLLDTDLSLPMRYFERRKRVGLVARTGVDRRAELCARLGVADDRRLALVYAGNWGMPFNWGRLTEHTGWRFLSLAPALNVSTVDREWMPHPDLVASVDLVVSKAGYGIVGECLANGTPLLYGPREGFVEYAALDRALRAWPGGLWLDAERFAAVDWAGALEAAPARGSLERVPAPGGREAADRIVRLASG